MAIAVFNSRASRRIDAVNVLGEERRASFE